MLLLAAVGPIDAATGLKRPKPSARMGFRSVSAGWGITGVHPCARALVSPAMHRQLPPHPGRGLVANYMQCILVVNRP